MKVSLKETWCLLARSIDEAASGSNGCNEATTRIIARSERIENRAIHGDFNCAHTHRSIDSFRHGQCRCVKVERSCVVCAVPYTDPWNVNVGGLSHSGENFLDRHFMPAVGKKFVSTIFSIHRPYRRQVSY